MSNRHGNNAVRQDALRKLGRLFALLDEAVTQGELDRAKNLLVDVRATLSVARDNELGASNLNPSDEIDR
jgi:hypothetical protein